MATGSQGQPAKSPRLLAEVQAVLRLHHYAIRTERAYCEWIRRYIFFHGMKSRADLVEGAAKVEAFLTHLAVVDKVAASTQNQAFNSLLFLYGQVVGKEVGAFGDFARAERPERMLVVLTGRSPSGGLRPKAGNVAWRRFRGVAGFSLWFAEGDGLTLWGGFVTLRP